MTKDFKNNLILLLLATCFTIIGWTVSTFIDGNLFKNFCEFGYCIKPIIISLYGIVPILLILFFVFLSL